MNTAIVWLLQFILPRRYWYRNFYLRSKHWRAIRRKKLESVGYRCEKSGIPMYSGTNQFTMLDVHHLTYDRLFRERLEDLQVLTRNAHMLEHGEDVRLK